MSERLVLAGSGSRQTAVSSADPFLLQVCQVVRPSGRGSLQFCSHLVLGLSSKHERWHLPLQI